MNKISRGEIPEGAKRATDGKSTVSKVLNKLESTPSAKPKPAGPKPGTYAYAKKRNPNLDKLIKQRKGLTKGTEEYNRVQNQINKATTAKDLCGKRLARSHLSLLLRIRSSLTPQDSC